MPNLTISLNDNILRAGREYAKKHHLSLNALIRDLLAKIATKSSKRSWLDECFHLMGRANGNSQGKKWKREDLYRV